MKIITENAAYVQKNDLMYLMQADDAIVPASIYLNVFGNGVVVINDSNRFEFVEFNKPEEIEFFKNIDWMINYDDLKDLSIEDIISLGQSITNKKNEIAKEFNGMTPQEKEENMDKVSQCELLKFKIYSLRDIVWIKQGRLKIKFPKENGKDAVSEEKKGISKLIKFFKNKKKK